MYGYYKEKLPVDHFQELKGETFLKDIAVQSTPQP